MHPALIILPALGLILGPRVWVNRVLKKYDGEEDRPDSAHEIARQMLDRHGLHAVAVEVTDLGDHYDPHTKAVRLSRHYYDRKSLTAITTAAHEVAHALQHATEFPPFVWRTRLAKVAQVTGEIGTVLVIAVPVTFLLSRHRLPPTVIGGAALAMLGTSGAAQFAALPTELDASFKRALPMLQQGFIDEDQVEAAHRILYACSLTYVAASLTGVLHIWPWLGRGRLGVDTETPSHLVAGGTRAESKERLGIKPSTESRPRKGRSSLRGGMFEATLRRLAKPVIRQLLADSHTQN